MNTISEKFCYLPFGSIYVGASGALSPCCIASPFKENIHLKNIILIYGKKKAFICKFFFQTTNYYIS